MSVYFENVWQNCFNHALLSCKMSGFKRISALTNDRRIKRTKPRGRCFKVMSDLDQGTIVKRKSNLNV